MVFYVDYFQKHFINFLTKSKQKIQFTNILSNSLYFLLSPNVQLSQIVSDTIEGAFCQPYHFQGWHIFWNLLIDSSKTIDQAQFLGLACWIQFSQINIFIGFSGLSYLVFCLLAECVEYSLDLLFFSWIYFVQMVHFWGDWSVVFVGNTLN